MTRMTGAERDRRYRAKDPARSREQTRQSVARWREANREAAREANRRWQAELRQAVFDHYGWACVCCAATDRLTIDHVNGDGAEHRAQVGGTWQIYRWIIANGFPEGFQTMCLPCNVSKKRGTHCRLKHREAA